MRALSQSDQISVLNGSPRYLGTITATTVKTNANTATPFTIPNGAALLIQPDAACYVGALTSSWQTQAAVTSANGLKLAADEKYILGLPLSGSGLQALAVSGTINLKVFVLE